MNQQTTTYRADRYSGDLTVSVGWLMEVHPTLTHAEKLTTMIREEMSLMRIYQEDAKDFQDKLPAYENRKKTHYNKMEVPPFHISTRVKSCNLNNKTFTTQTLAIHTSTSAENLITRLLSKAAVAGKILCFPLRGTRHLWLDMGL